MVVKAVLIIEVVGRPAEYLKEALKTHVEGINKVKSTSVTNLKIADSKKIEGQEDAYSCFAEVEVQTESLSSLMELVFEFMPSSVEILSPYNLEFNSQEASMLLNDLSGRLHKYDEIAKLAKIQVQQLAARFQQMQQQGRPQLIISENLPPKPLIKSEKKSSVNIKKKSSKKKK